MLLKDVGINNFTQQWSVNQGDRISVHVHLVPFCQLCFVFVSCVHRRVVEGSGEGSGGCVVHVDVHGECVTLWVTAK